VTSLSSLLLDNVGELFDLSLGSEECAELFVSEARDEVERRAGGHIVLSYVLQKAYDSARLSTLVGDLPSSW